VSILSPEPGRLKGSGSHGPSRPRVGGKKVNPGVNKGLGGNTQPPTPGSRAAAKRSAPTIPQKSPPPMGARSKRKK
jgi:hypothetical protein